MAASPGNVRKPARIARLLRRAGARFRPLIPPSGDGRPLAIFLKRGPFSFINARVGELLAGQFPELRVVTLDLFEDLLPRHPGVWAGSWAGAALRYGGDWGRRARSPGDCFERTSRHIRAVRRVIRAELEPWRGAIRFTFQTQGLFDGSLPGIPHFLYTDHTHLANLAYPEFDPARLFDPGWIDEEREIYRSADRVFVMSGHVRDSLFRQYAIAPGRVVLARAGCNVEPPRALPGPGRFARGNILFVGVDWGRKGGPELLEAFRAVRRAHPGATLTVVGCSPPVAEPGVEIAGRIPPEAAREHFARASVFCLPSRVEPFGIAAVEALAHGLPVVATRIGALADMVEEGRSGFLVPAGDPAALAAALGELVGDPARCEAFGARGRESALSRYSWDAVGAEIGGAIREVLGGGPRGGAGSGGKGELGEDKGREF